MASMSSGVTMKVAKTLRSPTPVTVETSAVGFGAGVTRMGNETRGMIRQKGVTTLSQNVLALSSGIPLSLGK